ncbi:MSS51 mitochondrial translational activator homolog (Saccharomyces cerevisiae) [Seminavis robusta]|uniref:MSS51 mitochondrial translational activator homolog (Saccharomyces cerevisiae) n=1 Tax=Seminavis robusta TaxID=568900 RepID=A0A9N8E3K5_9STRA|nr:MSS51 mitochondrial translational activator homolog (Saccharomyces cerevisiae) [Seminavis robusta]|eukprot:Sro624_g177290.1 MSS51 mitochondrial translational activator homolog (Saccharomyces cerevisiae) (346) ;mRNA; r:13974-15011
MISYQYISRALAVSPCRKRPFCHILGKGKTTNRLSSSTGSGTGTASSAGASPFVDPALEWGRAHSELAQACLKVPPLPSSPVTGGTSSSVSCSQQNHSLTNFYNYWNWRQWEFPVETDRDLKHGQALVTHVLSAPLTLANFVTTALLAHEEEQQDMYHLCCVGARAEATLPMEFWKEFLLALTHSTTTAAATRSIRIQMDFLGPDIHPQMPPQTLQYRDNQLQLQWLYRGYFHDYISDKNNNAPNWNAFVLFNPGLGHEHLKEGWRPTLQYLLQQHTQHRAPILLTFHSQLDAQRDCTLLLQEEHHLPELASNALQNPFASHITYEDPFDRSHMVQPNHSMIMLL